MKRLLILAALVAAPAAAQELRCTQIFMNASEKRICATPELMEQDATMGRLARRAEAAMPDYRREQKEFRRALKRCDGDGACLEELYAGRVAALTAAVESMPEPDQEQARRWAEEDAKAESKREAQADTRDAYAEQLQKADAAKAAEGAEEAPAPEGAAEQEPQVASIETPEQQIGPEAEAPVDEVQAELAASPAATATDSEPGWGTYAITAAILLGAWLAFWSWLTTVCRRCPDGNCKKWFGGVVYDYGQSSHTDYETKTFTDVHRDRNMRTIKTVDRKEQVAVRVTNRTDYLKCKACGNEWTASSTSRSS